MRAATTLKKATTLTTATALMAATALMTACSPEDSETQANKDAVSISTNVTLSNNLADTGAMQTRTAASETPYTSSGATLTLCYGSTDSSQKSAFTYTPGAGWTTTAPLYWQDLKPNASAPEAEKYAFYAVAPQMPTDMTKGAVKTDQSNSPASTAGAETLTSFECSDLLMAYRTAAKSGALDLNLKHLLSQLQVQLVSGDGADALTPDELATATLSISGVQTQYALAYSGTASYTANGSGSDTDTGSNTGSNDTDGSTISVPSIAHPALATGTGNAADNLKPYTDGTGAAKSFRFIAPPQTTDANGLVLKFTLTVAGTQRSYTYTSSDGIALTAGAITRMEITASRTALTLGSITVTDWTTPAAISGTVHIDVTGSADTPDGHAPAFGSMNIWKGQAAFSSNGGSSSDLTAAPASALEYKKTGSTWATTGTPFYVDDVAEADRFYALALNVEADGTPVTSPITGLNDPVAAGPIQMKGGSIAFACRHLLAKLHITLAADANFTGGLLTGATISTPAMSPGYTLSYDGGGSDAIIATATGSKAPYATLNPATDYIVAPQDLGSATFTVTLTNGNTYTATLPDLKLEPGKKTILALTLSPSETGITVSVKDWEASTASKTITIDGITNSGTPGITGNAPFAPTNGDALKLTYVISGDGSSDALSTLPGQSATYTYSGTHPDGSWTANPPLYWDNIAATGFTNRFAALYTYADSSTPEADFLTGTAASTTASGGNTGYGTPLSLTLSHAMAQISITLVPGEGYKKTDAGSTSTDGNGSTGSSTDDGTNDMLAALTTRIVRLQGIAAASKTPAVKPDGTPDITLSASVSDLIGGTNTTATGGTDNTFENGKVYTVAPQTLTDDHIILLRLANGNTYTLKLSDIEETNADGATGNKLFGGNDGSGSDTDGSTGSSGTGTASIAPGRKYAITITVNETAVSLSGSIEPWKELTGSGGMTPDWQL